MNRRWCAACGLVLRSYSFICSDSNAISVETGCTGRSDSMELASYELDTFENERLFDELKKAKEELFNLRFQSATGQLESHGRLRAVKRDIARIYTVLRERELGIRATPAPVEAPAKAEKKTKKAKAETESAVVDEAPAETVETKEA
jgi:large subunit ribosomal protein L29